MHAYTTQDVTYAGEATHDNHVTTHDNHVTTHDNHVTTHSVTIAYVVTRDLYRRQ